MSVKTRLARLTTMYVGSSIEICPNVWRMSFDQLLHMVARPGPRCVSVITTEIIYTSLSLSLSRNLDLCLEQRNSL